MFPVTGTCPPAAALSVATDGDSSSDAGIKFSDMNWYMDILRTALKPQKDPLRRALQVVSACSGIFTEGYALQSLNIPTSALYFIEPDEQCQKFILEEWSGRVRHIWNSFAEAEQSCLCCAPGHSTPCCFPAPASTDLLICSPPGQPFTSTVRVATQAESHQGFGVTFGETNSVLSMTKFLKPKIVIAEFPRLSTNLGSLAGIKPQRRFANSCTCCIVSGSRRRLVALLISWRMPL